MTFDESSNYQLFFLRNVAFTQKKTWLWLDSNYQSFRLNLERKSWFLLLLSFVCLLRTYITRLNEWSHTNDYEYYFVANWIECGKHLNAPHQKSKYGKNVITNHVLLWRNVILETKISETICVSIVFDFVWFVFHLNSAVFFHRNLWRAKNG